MINVFKHCWGIIFSNGINLLANSATSSSTVLSVWSRIFLDHSASGWLAETLYMEVPGNHTNIICHHQLNFLLVRAPKFLKPLQSLKLLSHVQLFCDTMDYTVHGILQARILEWVAFPFSRGSSQPPRDQTEVFYIASRFFTSWATRKAWCVYIPTTYIYTYGLFQPYIYIWFILTIWRIWLQ